MNNKIKKSILTCFYILYFFCGNIVFVGIFTILSSLEYHFYLEGAVLFDLNTIIRLCCYGLLFLNLNIVFSILIAAFANVTSRIALLLNIINFLSIIMLYAVFLHTEITDRLQIICLGFILSVPCLYQYLRADKLNYKKLLTKNNNTKILLAIFLCILVFIASSIILFCAEIWFFIYPVLSFIWIMFSFIILNILMTINIKYKYRILTAFYVSYYVYFIKLLYNKYLLKNIFDDKFGIFININNVLFVVINLVFVVIIHKIIKEYKKKYKGHLY